MSELEKALTSYKVVLDQHKETKTLDSSYDEALNAGKIAKTELECLRALRELSSQPSKLKRELNN